MIFRNILETFKKKSWFHGAITDEELEKLLVIVIKGKKTTPEVREILEKVLKIQPYLTSKLHLFHGLSIEEINMVETTKMFKTNYPVSFTKDRNYAESFAIKEMKKHQKNQYVVMETVLPIGTSKVLDVKGFVYSLSKEAAQRAKEEHTKDLPFFGDLRGVAYEENEFIVHNQISYQIINSSQKENYIFLTGKPIRNYFTVRS